jgi:four helix bundle protein
MRHENTIIYQKCLALMQTAQEAIEQFPKGFGFLADQLRRNTSSVAHNYAEGYYQHSTRQQRRFLDYAIQSAREVSTSFDTGLAFKATSLAIATRGKSLALELVKMLSKFRK